MSVTHTITGGLVHLSGNPIQITLTASAALLNHKLAIKVKCDQLLSPVQVEEIEPVNLVSVFNIGGLVDEPNAITLVYPPDGNANPYDLLARNISLEIGEVWNDANGDRTEAWTVVSTVLRVIDGKLRQHELSVLNEAGKSFASEYINGGKFLTHLPVTMKVSKIQMPRLWYLSRFTDNHPAQIHLKVNTNQRTFSMVQDKTFWTITGLIEMVVNPYFWGFNEFGEVQPAAGEYVVDYEFWITDSTGDISEHRYFHVDQKYYETEHYIFYKNPFSAVDHIWFHGEAKEGLKTELETAYTPVPVGAGTMRASLTTISATGQRSWTINTGVKSRAERIALRDFLEAKECWLQDPDDATRLIPVYTSSEDYSLNDTFEDDVQSLEITLTEAHKN